MAESYIAFQQLQKVYGDVVAVDGLNLEIQRGEFFGLLGPNGAGKTTTIGALFGLVRPTNGRILVDGLDTQTEYRTLHARMGLAPQEENLDFWFMTVKEILIYYAGYFGLKKREAEQRAEELLQLMDLWDKRNSYVNQLSGGMKRRLMLARAVMHDPEIIVMDEPTAGADVELRKTLWNYIARLQEEGKTIILTTHYIEEAEALCDRVGVMHQGQLVKTGTPEELKRELGEERIDLRVAKEQQNEAVQILKQFGEVTVAGNQIQAVVANAADVAEQLMVRLVKEEIAVKHIAVKENRLEDAYVRLIGEADV